MNARNYFRQLALTAMVLMSSLNAKAQAPDAFYIYMNDGTVMPFFNDVVDSVKWGNYDLEGNFHRVAVVQEIWTPDSVFRIPLELIDSVTFHKPENKYTADAVRMEQQPWWRYITGFVDSLNIIRLRKDIPEELMPKVRDKLVTTVQNDIFPGGYMGSVVYRATDSETGERVIVCSPLDFKDVFTEFTASAGFTAQDQTAAARSNGPRQRHINLDKTIHWPKIDFLGSSFGLQIGKSEDLGHDVSGALSGGISWTWEPEYDIELWVHWSVETGLEYNYVHHESVNLKRSLNVTGTGSWHKDKPFGHFKYAIPNCPLLWWYVEPGVFADFSVSAAVNWFTQRKYKNYIFAKYSEYEPDLNVYTSRTVDEGPGESSTTTFTLGGSLSAGFYAEVGLRVPPYFVDINNFEIVKDENSKYLIGRVQLGARIEGSAEINMNELIGGAFKDASMYRMLNHEVSFALTAFLSGELKLQTPFGGTWSVSAPYEVTASLGTKFGIVPSFDNLNVRTGKLDSIYYAICNSDVARNLIIPVRNMGFTVRDSKGNTAARVGNRYYWLTTFEHMCDTIRGLEPGMKYSLHPSFDIFGIIPMLGYPKEDFTVGTLTLDFKPDPITATRERNVLRLPISTNARQADVTVTDGMGWLHATTDSLTLLVRTDSLPGGTTREGKLKLKAMTSDKENFVEQEVKVIQTPLPMIELDPEAVNFLSTGGTERVAVRLKEPDRTVTVSGQPDWLGVAVSGSSVTLTAQPNPDKVRPRTCTLTIIATDKGGSRAEQPLPVEQQCEQPALIVEPEEIVLDALSNTGYVEQKLNIRWMKDARNPELIPSADLDWLTGMYPSSWVLNGDYKEYFRMISATSNLGNLEERSGKLTVRITLNDGSVVEKAVSIRQKAHEIVHKFTPDKLTLVADLNSSGRSDAQQVGIETNLMGYGGPIVSMCRFETSDDWLHVQSTDEWWNPFTVWAAANLERDSRKGTVTQRLTLTTGLVVERTVEVTQEGTAAGEVFIIDPEKPSAPAEGGECVIRIIPKEGVQIDRIWEVDCHTGSSWLGGSGMNLTAIMYAEPNPGKEPRQRDFAITVLMKDGSKVTQHYVFYQEAHTLFTEPSELLFKAEGGLLSTHLETAYEPVQLIPNGDWFIVERSGDGIFVTAEANPTSQPREGSIVLSCQMEDGTPVRFTLYVKQEAATFHVTPSFMYFQAKEDTQYATFLPAYDNVDVSPTGDWFTVSRESNKLTVTATPNYTEDFRRGQIMLSAQDESGKTVACAISLSQYSPTLRIEPGTLTFEGTGGERTPSIVSNLCGNEGLDDKLSISASADWIKFERVYNSRMGLKLTIDPNPIAQQRTGTVSLSYPLPNGRTLTASLAITQKAGNVTPEELELLVGSDVKFDKNENYAYKSPWTNCDYITATANASWLTVNVDGEGRIVIYAPENSGATRTAKITVTGYKTDAPGATPRTITQYLNVTQEGNGQTPQPVDFDYEVSAVKAGFSMTYEKTSYNKDGSVRSVETTSARGNEFSLYAESEGNYKPLIGDIQTTPISGGIHVKVVGTMEDFIADQIEFDLMADKDNLKLGTIRNVKYVQGDGYALQAFGDVIQFNADNIPSKEKDNKIYEGNFYKWEATEGTGLKVSDFECMNEERYRNKYCYASNPANKVTIQLSFKKKEQKDYSGGFLGEWHNGSTTLILRADGTYYKKVGSAAAVTGTYELLSYNLNGLNFSGTLKEPGGNVVSFSGAYPYDDLWPSTMKYDGVNYHFDDGM